jgi:hypothetical protein
VVEVEAEVDKATVVIEEHMEVDMEVGVGLVEELEVEHMAAAEEVALVEEVDTEKVVHMVVVLEEVVEVVVAMGVMFPKNYSRTYT